MTELDLAIAAAVSGGAHLRRRPSTVSHKGAIDLVTEVDLASEQAIREVLEPTGIPVQAEEGGGAQSGSRWVVDPLDGTTNFVHDYPFYCVSIALMDGERPVVGVIYDPIREHLYAAQSGRGATRNGEPLRVSGARTLGESLAVTGFPADQRERAPVFLRYVERILLHTRGLRRSGSAAMDLAMIAAGQVDFYWEFGLKAWDTAGGQCIVTEAGGVVSRLDGSAHVPGCPEVLATNPWLHEAVMQLFLETGSTPWA